MTIRALNEIGTIQLGDVQETLLTPLCARADQLGRRDAIVIDEAAKQLVDAIEYDFEKIRRFPNTLTGCAIRAAIMDDWIQAFLKEHPAGAIGLFGVGLDTVFERNDNGRANWFELDFADVIALRQVCFEPDSRRHLIAGDVFDTSWIDKVREATEGPWLFQAAGLLMYLQPAQVTQLFQLLASHFPGAIFLFDGCSQLAKRNSNRWEATIRTTAAEYHWAIDDPRELEAWDERIHVTDIRYMLDHHRHQWRWNARIGSRLFPKLRKAYHINRARISS